MKRGARLAVLVLALAVLVGAWFLAERLSGSREAALASHAHEEEISLAVGTAEDVNAVSWNYFGDAVSLKYDAEADKWLNAEDEACPINDEAVLPLVDAVASTSAVGVVENVTDFDQYGLADPAFVVMAATADKVTTYYVGNSNAAGTWYVRLDGDDKVYLEDGTLAAWFQLGLEDVLDLEHIDVKTEDVTAMAVRSDAGDYSLAQLEDPESAWYTNAFPWFLLDGAGKVRHPADTAGTEELIGLATGLTLTDCVSWSAGDGAEYGLDEPQAEVALTCGGNEPSVTLQFGDYDNGDVYVRLAGSELVYKIAGTVLDGLMYPDTEGLRPLSPSALDWDRLTGMTLALEEGTYEVERTYSAQEGEEPEPIYTADGRSLNGEKVALWLDQVRALPADSLAPAGAGRRELFTLTFRQDIEAFPEVTVAFYAYDSVHHLCVVNGEEFYLVSRTAADAVADNAADLFKADE